MIEATIFPLPNVTRHDSYRFKTSWEAAKKTGKEPKTLTAS